MARTVKGLGRARSRQGRRIRSARNQSPTKEFNPSHEVRIVPKRDSDGRETWEVVIARSAMQKLAAAAGVIEADLGWLGRALEFAMSQLQDRKSNRARAPSSPNLMRHLRATSTAVRMHLGHGAERTDKFIAFAEILYLLAGFAMRPPALRAQLTMAVKRRFVVLSACRREESYEPLKLGGPSVHTPAR
jgi:hypothetical protein